MERIYKERRGPKPNPVDPDDEGDWQKGRREAIRRERQKKLRFLPRLLPLSFKRETTVT